MDFVRWFQQQDTFDSMKFQARNNSFQHEYRIKEEIEQHDKVVENWCYLRFSKKRNSDFYLRFY